MAKAKPQVKKQVKAGAKVVAITRTAPSAEDAAMAMATQAAGAAMLVTVKDEASNVAASSMLVQLRQAQKKVEEARSFLVKPLKDHVKAIEAKFKPTLETLDRAETTLKQKILTYRREVEQHIEAEKTKALEAAYKAQERGDTEKAAELATQAVALAGPAKQTLVGDGAVQAKKRWTFEVMDVGQVPREYLAVDSTKVRAAIRAGLREVPGLRIFQTDELAVGTD